MGCRTCWLGEDKPLMWACLLQWAFIDMGWVDSDMCVVKLLLQSMQLIAVTSQLYFWSNRWASLCFSCLKWVKWGRQAHLPISEKEERETWVPRGNNSLFSFYLKLFWLCGALWTAVLAGWSWIKVLGFSCSLNTLFRPENGWLELAAGVLGLGLQLDFTKSK